jgi:Amt family ammonium transporter
MLAPMGTLAVWMALDLARTRRATAVGAATGMVVGLVAVTPAAGFVSPAGALLLGALAALPSYVALLWRSRTRLDDSLDVVAAHGLGGTVGALLTGVFAAAAWGGTDGWLAGNAGLVGKQAVAVLATLGYSAGMTLVLLKLVDRVLPLRVGRREEAVGVDVHQHGEEAYTSGEGAILVIAEPGAAAPPGKEA